jgi:hypothetical protein
MSAAAPSDGGGAMPLDPPVAIGSDPEGEVALPAPVVAAAARSPVESPAIAIGPTVAIGAAKVVSAAVVGAERTKVAGLAIGGVLTTEIGAETVVVSTAGV